MEKQRPLEITQRSGEERKAQPTAEQLNVDHFQHLEEKIEAFAGFGELGKAIIMQAKLQIMLAEIDTTLKEGGIHGIESARQMLGTLKQTIERERESYEKVEAAHTKLQTILATAGLKDFFEYSKLDIREQLGRFAEAQAFESYSSDEERARAAAQFVDEVQAAEKAYSEAYRAHEIIREDGMEKILKNVAPEQLDNTNIA